MSLISQCALHLFEHCAHEISLGNKMSNWSSACKFFRILIFLYFSGRQVNPEEKMPINGRYFSLILLLKKCFKITVTEGVIGSMKCGSTLWQIDGLQKILCSYKIFKTYENAVVQLSESIESWKWRPYCCFAIKKITCVCSFIYFRFNVHDMTPTALRLLNNQWELMKRESPEEPNFCKTKIDNAIKSFVSLWQGQRD